MTKILKWGIIGTGNIARKFVDDLSLLSHHQAIAVTSRDLETAMTFAQSKSIPHYYDDYAKMLKNEDVDIIYVAIPHHRHVDLSIQALEAGKHVLCEKPAAIQLEGLQKVVNCAKQNNRFFMEGLWSRFNPSIDHMLTFVRSNGLGKIKYINADFCFPAPQNEQGRLFNKSLAGGSLLDIGIYPLFLSYVLLGMPTALEASANFHKTGVDLQCAMILKYEDAHAILYSSLDVKSQMEAQIYGEQGKIVLNSRWHEAKGLEIYQASGKTTHTFDIQGNGFTEEMEECYRCIESGQIESPRWSHQDCINLMTLLETVMQKTGIDYSSIT